MKNNARNSKLHRSHHTHTVSDIQESFPPLFITNSLLFYPGVMLFCGPELLSSLAPYSFMSNFFKISTTMTENLLKSDEN